MEKIALWCGCKCLAQKAVVSGSRHGSSLSNEIGGKACRHLPSPDSAQSERALCTRYDLYVYQCPPFRLSYQGLGEPLCFAAFGPFATTSFYLFQSNRSDLYNLPLAGTNLPASLLVGFTTSLILFCSHFHQVDGDLAVGKMSPLVRIGTKAGSLVVKTAVVALLSHFVCSWSEQMSSSTSIILCALTLPIGKLVVSHVEGNHSDKSKIFMAKYYCVRLHFSFGAALSIGLLAARAARPYLPQPFIL